MKRITIKHLEKSCSVINNHFGMPSDTRSDGHWNIGTFYIDQAYGGCALYRVANDAGGVEDVLGYHMPKKELYHRMMGFIRISNIIG